MCLTKLTIMSMMLFCLRMRLILTGSNSKEQFDKQNASTNDEYRYPNEFLVILIERQIFRVAVCYRPSGVLHEADPRAPNVVVSVRALMKVI
jgi:hypothetical protein